MAASDNEDLPGLVRALRDELGALRGEVDSLREEVKQLRGSPAAPPAAPAPSRLPAWLRKPLWTPKPRKTVYWQPANHKTAAGRAAAAPPAFRLDEKFIGEKLLQYAGVAILALGVVF
ncbi:MAG: hypothetical protein KGL74_06045, partial [Elusimicrobia bacterium]|nr:hypothetical protein [Elusimicrobiota bacterium]